MANCPVFCGMYEIWKSQGDILVENDVAYAIFTRRDIITPGQVLLAPKRHVDRLRDLTDAECGGLISRLIPSAFDAIQEIYQRDSEKIVAFYEKLRDGSDNLSSKSAIEILDNPWLSVMPEGYNAGVNRYHVAGQRMAHLHWHLVPRRTGDGNNLGFQTGLKQLLG